MKLKALNIIDITIVKKLATANGLLLEVEPPRKITNKIMNRANKIIGKKLTLTSWTY